MKLRIQGNSLRLRLTRPEVIHLRHRGQIESSVSFAPGCELTYGLKSSAGIGAIAAGFDGRSIVVTVPTAVMNEWAEGDRVSLEGPSSAGVQLLIEKDFQCLHKPDYLDPEAYPNPLAAREEGQESQGAKAPLN